jgi:hypothetical protein
MDVDADEQFVGRVTDKIMSWGSICSYEDAAIGLEDYADEEVRSSSVARYILDIRDLGRDIERFLSYAMNDAINAASQVIRNVELNREQARRDALPRPIAVVEEVMTTVADVGTSIGAAVFGGNTTPSFADAGDSEMSGMEFLDTVDEDEAVILMDDYSSDVAAAVVLLEAPYENTQAFHNAFLEYLRETRAPNTAANALRS